MQADADVSDNSNDSDFRDDKSVTVQQLKGIRSQPQKNRLSDVDISSLERDSERLARKAQKRLNRSFDGRSESVIEKFVGWHRKKKLDKVKVMLASLFPKLKHSEDEVKAWVQNVTEEKEAAMVTGRALLFDVEHQIALYQNHLEFLDEVVNDVRQLDYDVVREIGELKVALHFNQELLRKSKPASTAHAAAPPLPELNIIEPETLLVDELSYPPVANVVDDGNVHLRHNVKIKTTAFAAPPTPVAEPAVWQGIKHSPEIKSSPVFIATSPFTRSLSKLLSNCTDSPRIETPASERTNSTAGFGIRTNDISEDREERSSILTQQLVWDGAESKRKLLNSSCVSLQSLSRPPSLDMRERSNSNTSELPKMTKSASSGESFFTSIFQRQTSSSGSSTPTNVAAMSKDEKEKSFQRSASLGTTNSRRNSTGSQQEAPRHEATPMRGRADSSSSHVSTSSDASSRASVDSDVAVFSNDTLFPGTKVVKKYKNNRANSGLKLSSLLQILPDEHDQDMSAANDSDQEEMIRRINKCLVLKEILKSILFMIQETQETENDRLKKIKKLRVDLKIAIFGDPNFVPSPPSVIGIMQQTSSNRNSLDLRSKLGDGGASTATPDKPGKSKHILNAPPMVREVSEESMGSTPDFISHHELQHSYQQQSSHEFKRWSSETSNQSDGSHSPSFLRRGHPANPMMLALHNDPHYFSQESHDSLSMASTSSPMADGGFQEAAGDFVDDLKALVSEEKNAKEKLAILGTLIESAASIDSQLSTIAR